MDNDIQSGSTGVLLINLGTPESYHVKDVRRYLRQFLADKRVIDLPWLVRNILLYAFILPFRPKQSAKAYQAIWHEVHGSPLLFHSQTLKEQLAVELGEKYKVALGMRYATPSIKEALNELCAVGCNNIIILPLFPQYSSAATGSALEEVLTAIAKQGIIPRLKVHSAFFADPHFIAAQIELLKQAKEQHQPQTIIFSYHSLPVRQIKKGGSSCKDHCWKNASCPALTSFNQHCYRAQCFATSRLLAEQCKLQLEEYEVAFQSRLGRTEWVGPDIEATFKKLRAKNITRIMVSCPSFVADCLETLEEIGIRAKEQWLALGGESFHLVPCLNASPSWVEALAHYIRKA